MCGIFATINNIQESSSIEKEFMKGKNRGPEFSILKTFNNITIGFHRLAINGLNEKSNQPFEINNLVLICNGEIYNYRELAITNNIKLTTDSDCEIILHLYKLYGLEYTLHLLDGVFAFIIYDKLKATFIIARDPYGIRPLYYYTDSNQYGFASELKSIYKFPHRKKLIQNFLPGNYMILSNLDSKITCYLNKYHSLPYSNNLNQTFDNQLSREIFDNFSNAIKKRVISTTDRPIGCLLSGGLDSSIVAAFVNYYINLNNTTKMSKQLETFSIGLPGSEDLKYAKIVAKHLNSKHHEIVVSQQEFFNCIPEVIDKIASYDTTTVRASVGNYLIAKYIKENTNCKVIFNGDGADELMGGYLYFKKSPNEYEFDKESRRLLKDIYMFDVLRSDRSISCNGLEARTPFLDKTWVEFYLSINRKLRFESTINRCEKFLFRKAIETVNSNLLPKEILWRTKEAFSDGVSSLDKSWYEIISEKIIDLFKDSNNFLENDLISTYNLYRNFNLSNNIPETYEQCYYRYIYNKSYQGTDDLIQYFWMPKYVNAKDASARSLKIYNQKNSNILK
tara:strand:+ start:745 stop:2436 length:1692 start_codon:yes stop_codon:yes gene_type:complete